MRDKRRRPITLSARVRYHRILAHLTRLTRLARGCIGGEIKRIFTISSSAPSHTRIHRFDLSTDTPTVQLNRTESSSRPYRARSIIHDPHTRAHHSFHHASQKRLVSTRLDFTLLPQVTVRTARQSALNSLPTLHLPSTSSRPNLSAHHVRPRPYL